MIPRIVPRSAFALYIAATLCLCGCHMPIRKAPMRNACDFLYANPRVNQYVRHYAPTPGKQALTLAFIKHESGFQAKARPVKKWLIRGWIPWTYHSSARGYAQITDATWQDFSQAQNGLVSRYALVDHIHFINWYFYKHERHLSNPGNFYEAYFLYHDGPAGYYQKKYRRSHRLHRFTQRVAADAQRYQHQLANCQQVLAWQARWQQF